MSDQEKGLANSSTISHGRFCRICKKPIGARNKSLCGRDKCIKEAIHEDGKKWRAKNKDRVNEWTRNRYHRIKGPTNRNRIENLEKAIQQLHQCIANLTKTCEYLEGTLSNILEVVDCR